MRGAAFRAPRGALSAFDGLLAWKAANGTARYLVEEKPHLPHLDVQVVIQQLKDRRSKLPPQERGGRLLLLAPHVRPHQAAVLEQNDVDYIDLVGNAHLELPGMFVHVEGRRPPKKTNGPIRRPRKAWVKTVLALLVRPGLAAAPYRELATQADVALGTVAGCMNDLVVRGLVREGPDGRRLADRPQLVALWVQAYVDVLRPTLEEQRFQLKADTKEGIWRRLQEVLGRHKIPWALTGADAAERRDHFFRAGETEIYAPRGVFGDRELQKKLPAQPAARVGNLVVIEPPGPLALPPRVERRIPIAPELLLYAELRYRGTGQALEAAEMLLPAVVGNGAR
jgi:hypothetical protein